MSMNASQPATTPAAFLNSNDQPTVCPGAPRLPSWDEESGLSTPTTPGKTPRRIASNTQDEEWVGLGLLDFSFAIPTSYYKPEPPKAASSPAPGPEAQPHSGVETNKPPMSAGKHARNGTDTSNSATLTATSLLTSATRASGAIDANPEQLHDQQAIEGELEKKTTAQVGHHEPEEGGGINA